MQVYARIARFDLSAVVVVVAVSILSVNVALAEEVQA
jgi:hypothetical protein